MVGLEGWPGPPDLEPELHANLPEKTSRYIALPKIFANVIRAETRNEIRGITSDPFLSVEPFSTRSLGSFPWIPSRLVFGLFFRSL